jgi:hypothetical protein
VLDPAGPWLAPLRQLEVRLRSLQRSLLLMQLRCELLGILNRSHTFLRYLLLREYQRCLRLIHLRLAGVYLCVLKLICASMFCTPASASCTAALF